MYENIFSIQTHSMNQRHDFVVKNTLVDFKILHGIYFILMLSRFLIVHLEDGPDVNWDIFDVAKVDLILSLTTPYFANNFSTASLSPECCIVTYSLTRSFTEFSSFLKFTWNLP